MINGRFISIPAAALAAALSSAPALAGNGGEQEYQACLARAASAPNEREARLARSQCMYEHFDYMASYGP